MLVSLVKFLEFPLRIREGILVGIPRVNNSGIPGGVVGCP